MARNFKETSSHTQNDERPSNGISQSAIGCYNKRGGKIKYAPKRCMAPGPAWRDFSNVSAFTRIFPYKWSLEVAGMENVLASTIPGKKSARLDKILGWSFIYGLNWQSYTGMM